MKKIKLILPAILLLAACSKESTEISPAVSTSNMQAAKVNVARPFRAIINATANTDAAIPPTSCSGDLPGFSAPDFLLTGSATHMGDFIPQISNLHHVSCDLSFATMLLTTNVSVQLAANNGDLLYCTGNDVVNVAALLTQTGTTGSITGTWTINGGTGRFEGATGSFTINGFVDFISNSFNCECVGTITY